MIPGGLRALWLFVVTFVVTMGLATVSLTTSQAAAAYSYDVGLNSSDSTFVASVPSTAARVSTNTPSTPSTGDLSVHRTGFVAAETADSLTPSVGQRIYRVYGGDSKAGGASWSPVDPRTVGDYRDVAELPSGNTGQFVIEGTLNDPSAGVVRRGALPLDGTKGGLPEHVIPNLMNTGSVTIDRVSGANPGY